MTAVALAALKEPLGPDRAAALENRKKTNLPLWNRIA